MTFQACPDISQTESKDETLTCLAQWADDRDAHQTFLVGTLDTRYRRTTDQRLRCFLLRKTSNGFLMAQSSDATCHGGLSSPTEGFQTFDFSSGKKDNGLSFPDWTTDLTNMLSFDFKKLFTFNEDHSVLSVSNYSYTTGESVLVSNMSVVKTVEEGRNYVKIITRTLTGCEHIYNCAMLFWRTDSILELEEGLPTRVRLAACSQPNFVPSGPNNKHTLLLKQNLEMEECNLFGVHNVTSLSLGSKTLQWLCESKGFNRLEIQCSSPMQLQFIRECSEPEIAVYFCQGGWEESLRVSDLQLLNNRPSVVLENNLFSQYQLSTPDIGDVSSETITRGFIIAKPRRRDSKSNKRVCLIYTIVNGTYLWTVEKAGCERRLVPGVGGEHRFNTTLTGPCGGELALTLSYVLLTFVTFVVFI